MIIFATSDKGGTGRSVTSCNIAYRRAMQGSNVCYLDFDFGSPTAGAIFGVEAAGQGTSSGSGLHTYLAGGAADAEQLDIWARSRLGGRWSKPLGAGRLTLLPGDAGGGDFPVDDGMVRRCSDLFLRLDEEFELTLVDLSSGRSYATELALRVTADPIIATKTARWLVFHRWTRQHIVAAAGLVYGPQGILDTGSGFGHERRELEDRIRFVRTAVLEPDSAQFAALRPEQSVWLESYNTDLEKLAGKLHLGMSMMLGSIPLDPVLQWREQIIVEEDIAAVRIVNEETGQAFEALARRLTDDNLWEGL
ncbi:MinD-like ATPase involved in chromosome partitioning or flagellar assembly [Parafrankia irregularis]|uniref:MinD-like ATPase involved in chromosome partitioning or flagellar assembly n=1 Tax=Parafrankia irregularis TaxID=795642 RepID=A0A0S4QL17_9ACTN|nr:MULTISPECIES: SCO2523 family variant P-loop protein [Parafrankia]MBE3203906.1 ParA family protein [Parafrankia sp. CH37]CUU55222.1 MinD-like ATPase involved in chromosome partitioning or flagellar assembly [Parafrankia irregularis]